MWRPADAHDQTGMVRLGGYGCDVGGDLKTVRRDCRAGHATEVAKRIQDNEFIIRCAILRHRWAPPPGLR